MDNMNLLFRKKLQSAHSKEELETLTLELVKKIQNRYKFLHVLAEEGNVDILQRLDFLLRTAEGRVLDIGCFDGFYAIKLTERNHQVIGLDMLDLCINYATERLGDNTLDINFIKGFAEDLPFSDDSFDTTILSHTLEHVFDCTLALREAIRVTKNKGKLIVIIPKEFGNDPTHIRHISSSDLRNKLRRYSIVSDEFKVGKGVGYVCTVKK